jgi:hypothetical protein
MDVRPRRNRRAGVKLADLRGEIVVDLRRAFREQACLR